MLGGMLSTPSARPCWWLKCTESVLDLQQSPHERVLQTIEQRHSIDRSIFRVWTRGLPFHQRDVAMAPNEKMLQKDTRKALLVQFNVGNSFQHSVTGHRNRGGKGGAACRLVSTVMNLPHPVLSSSCKSRSMDASCRGMTVRKK
jgi:hypothetical protein